MDYKDYQKLNAAKNTNFWYEARKVLIFILLDSVYHQAKPDKNILDIGCGTGTELTVLKKFGEIIGLDSNLDAIKILQRSGYNVLCGDIEKINLQINFYDCICCFDVLEHLPDDSLVVKKIYTSLCEDGYFIFTVPAFQFLFSPHDQAMGHYRRYSKQRIKEILQDNGFKIVTINYWNFFLFPGVVLFRLVKKIVYGLKRKNTYNPDLKNFSNIFNKIFFSILNAENFLCKYKVKFPFGLSIYGIAKK